MEVQLNLPLLLSLMEQADVDGALIGGASLKADEFLKILIIYNFIHLFVLY